MNVGFVTPELDPYTPGGAGVLVAELRRRMIDAGWRPAVAVVGEWAATPEAGVGVFPDESAAVAWLLDQGVDAIEFVDFGAPSFEALTDRAAHGLENIRVLVRYHGPVGELAEAMVANDPEWAATARRETETFRMADAAMVPSEATARRVAARYDLDSDRVVVAPPPVRPRPGAPLVDGHREIVVLGRLSEVKGSHDFLPVAVSLLQTYGDLTVRYVGEDGWSASQDRSMREWLTEMVPRSLRSRLTFEDRVPGDRLGEALSRAWCVVTPSRYESFCLSAREARGLGHAVVVSDLDAFADVGPDVGFVKVAVPEMEAALRKILADPGERDRLRATPRPAYGDPLEPYGEELPAPRHPRSQAALATAALARVLEPEVSGGAAARLAAAVLRLLPGWAGRIAAKLVPRGTKERFRRLASWPAEVGRRQAQSEQRSLRAAIESGAYPDLDDPLVSVVIPCFNQGTFVAEAIESVFRQTRPDFEILVVDDGSTDAQTRSILGALSYPRTRVVHQDNRGLPGARNRGISEARGRYIVPLDADDQLHRRFIEVMVDAIESSPEAAYAHCYAELFGDIGRIWVTRPWNPYQLLIENSVVGCVLLRRDAWTSVGGYDEHMTEGNEDWDLWIRLSAAGWNQVQVPEPLFRYRKHGVSMSVDTEARVEEHLVAMRRRHPDLYDLRRMADGKRRWYPMATLVGEEMGSAPPDIDVETLRTPVGELEDAVRRAHGKYMVWCDGPANIHAVVAAARHLENHADQAAAVVDGVEMWRRWALLDPSAPLEPPPSAGGPLSAVQLSDWALPSFGLDLPVLRQRPEVPGFPEEP